MIAVGGALGALLRVGVGELAVVLTADTLERSLLTPWVTLAINLLGSIGIGFLLVFSLQERLGTNLHVFLVIGLLGSFTTFSTFSREVLLLFLQGNWQLAGGYALSGAVIPILGAALGYAIGTRYA
ncbi:MAG: fluoride efflux transporter FluC [Gammaproteobacteria bacterium]